MKDAGSVEKEWVLTRDMQSSGQRQRVILTGRQTGLRELVFRLGTNGTYLSLRSEAIQRRREVGGGRLRLLPCAPAGRNSSSQQKRSPSVTVLVGDQVHSLVDRQ